VIAVPGDRRDEDIRAVGRHAARLDHVIVKEDAERRGREPGEVAQLLVEGLREGGMRGDAISVIPDEREALEHMLERLGRGDLGIVLADDVPLVLAKVQRRSPGASVA
jgi:cyanophycin synthetase